MRAATRMAAAALLALMLTSAWPQPANPAPAEPRISYTVQPRDTLIGLSQRLLRDPRQWPLVARLNRLPNANRITPGRSLELPLAWVRAELAQAQLLERRGDVRIGDQPAGTTASLPEGGRVQTGSDGSATLRLVDGSLLRLRGNSELLLQESRQLPDGLGARTRVRLERGRAEVKAAPARGGQPGFEVGTPQGVLAVRGTEYRVAAGEAQDPRTRGEVLEGLVQLQGARGSQPVRAGQGGLVDADGKVPIAVPLLPAPALTDLPALAERPLLRLQLPPLKPPALAYRVQVAEAADSGFNTLAADVRSNEALVRIAGLADGDYRLRVRSVDAQGLEGLDAEHRLRLKARPEPPLVAEPLPKARLFGASVRLRWAANPDAVAYQLQLTRDPSFGAGTLERHFAAGTETALMEGMAPATYYWRLRSWRLGDDAGPWGEAVAFELRALPPAPPPAKVSDSGVELAWPGEPGQQYDLELARDASFTQPVLQRRLLEPRAMLQPPGTGRFFVRLRTIEADGFVGPYTSAQTFDVPNCLRHAGGCVRSTDGPVLMP